MFCSFLIKILLTFRTTTLKNHLELTLNCENKCRDHTPLFFVQAFTLEHFRSQTDSAKEEAFRLNSKNDLKCVFKVNVSFLKMKQKQIFIFFFIKFAFLLKSNKILQVTLAKNWSNIGHITADYTIKFSGLYPKNAGEIHCLSSQPLPLEIGSYLRDEDCDPTVSWKHHIQPLKYNIPIV